MLPVNTDDQTSEERLYLSSSPPPAVTDKLNDISEFLTSFVVVLSSWETSPEDALPLV